MPAGRPTKYHSKYCDDVITAGGSGYSLAAFAGQIGVARDTISEWVKVHPEFSAAVKAHKARRAHFWEQALQRGVFEGLPPGAMTGIIFSLKNVAPEEWRDKHEMEHSGNVIVQSVSFEDFAKADDDGA